MKIKIALAFLIFSTLVYSQTDNITIDYFGQTPPDTIPVIFAPGNICLDNRFEARGAFSPDGRLFYFTFTDEDFTLHQTGLVAMEYLIFIFYQA